MLEIYLSSCSSSARYLQFISYLMFNNIVTSKSYCNFKSCKYAVNWFWKSLPCGKSVKSFAFGICICLWVFEVRSWCLGSVDTFWKIWWFVEGTLVFSVYTMLRHTWSAFPVLYNFRAEHSLFSLLSHSRWEAHLMCEGRKRAWLWGKRRTSRGLMSSYCKS